VLAALDSDRCGLRSRHPANGGSGSGGEGLAHFLLWSASDMGVDIGKFAVAKIRIA